MFPVKNLFKVISHVPITNDTFEVNFKSAEKQIQAMRLYDILGDGTVGHNIGLVSYRNSIVKFLSSKNTCEMYMPIISSVGSIVPSDRTCPLVIYSDSNLERSSKTVNSSLKFNVAYTLNSNVSETIEFSDDMCNALAYKPKVITFSSDFAVDQIQLTIDVLKCIPDELPSSAGTVHEDEWKKNYLYTHTCECINGGRRDLASLAHDLRVALRDHVFRPGTVKRVVRFSYEIIRKSEFEHKRSVTTDVTAPDFTNIHMEIGIVTNNNSIADEQDVSLGATKLVQNASKFTSKYEFCLFYDKFDTFPSIAKFLSSIYQTDQYVLSIRPLSNTKDGAIVPLVTSPHFNQPISKMPTYIYYVYITQMTHDAIQTDEEFNDTMLPWRILCGQDGHGRLAYENLVDYKNADELVTSLKFPFSFRYSMETIESYLQLTSDLLINGTIYKFIEVYLGRLPTRKSKDDVDADVIDMDTVHFSDLYATVQSYPNKTMLFERIPTGSTEEKTMELAKSLYLWTLLYIHKIQYIPNTDAIHIYSDYATRGRDSHSDSSRSHTPVQGNTTANDYGQEDDGAVDENFLDDIEEEGTNDASSATTPEPEITDAGVKKLTNVENHMINVTTITDAAKHLFVICQHRSKKKFSLFRRTAAFNSYGIVPRDEQYIRQFNTKSSVCQILCVDTLIPTSTGTARIDSLILRLREIISTFIPFVRRNDNVEYPQISYNKNKNKTYKLFIKFADPESAVTIGDDGRPVDIVSHNNIGQDYAAIMRYMLRCIPLDQSRTNVIYFDYPQYYPFKPAIRYTEEDPVFWYHDDSRRGEVVKNWLMLRKIELDRLRKDVLSTELRSIIANMVYQFFESGKGWGRIKHEITENVKTFELFSFLRISIVNRYSIAYEAVRDKAQLVDILNERMDLVDNFMFKEHVFNLGRAILMPLLVNDRVLGKGADPFFFARRQFNDLAGAHLKYEIYKWAHRMWGIGTKDPRLVDLSFANVDGNGSGPSYDRVRRSLYALEREIRERYKEFYEKLSADVSYLKCRSLPGNKEVYDGLIKYLEKTKGKPVQIGRGVLTPCRCCAERYVRDRFIFHVQLKLDSSIVMRIRNTMREMSAFMRKDASKFLERWSKNFAPKILPVERWTDEHYSLGARLGTVPAESESAGGSGGQAPITESKTPQEFIEAQHARFKELEPQLTLVPGTEVYDITKLGLNDYFWLKNYVNTIAPKNIKDFYNGKIPERKAGDVQVRVATSIAKSFTASIGKFELALTASKKYTAETAREIGDRLLKKITTIAAEKLTLPRQEMALKHAIDVYSVDPSEKKKKLGFKKKLETLESDAPVEPAEKKRGFDAIIEWIDDEEPITFIEYLKNHDIMGRNYSIYGYINSGKFSDITENVGTMTKFLLRMMHVIELSIRCANKIPAEKFTHSDILNDGADKLMQNDSNLTNVDITPIAYAYLLERGSNARDISSAKFNNFIKSIISDTKSFPGEIYRSSENFAVDCLIARYFYKPACIDRWVSGYRTGLMESKGRPFIESFVYHGFFEDGEPNSDGIPMRVFKHKDDLIKFIRYVIKLHTQVFVKNGIPSYNCTDFIGTMKNLIPFLTKQQLRKLEEAIANIPPIDFRTDHVNGIESILEQISAATKKIDILEGTLESKDEGIDQEKYRLISRFPYSMEDYIIMRKTCAESIRTFYMEYSYIIYPAIYSMCTAKSLICEDLSGDYLSGKAMAVNRSMGILDAETTEVAKPKTQVLRLTSGTDDTTTTKTPKYASAGGHRPRRNQQHQSWKSTSIWAPLLKHKPSTVPLGAARLMRASTDPTSGLPLDDQDYGLDHPDNEDDAFDNDRTATRYGGGQYAMNSTNALVYKKNTMRRK
jgi:hypothetical protein